MRRLSLPSASVLLLTTLELSGAPNLLTNPRFEAGGICPEDGYRTKAAGDIEVKKNGNITIDFQLQPGSDPDDLRVKFGTLSPLKFVAGTSIPDGAMIADKIFNPPKITNVRFADAHAQLPSVESAQRDVSGECSTELITTSSSIGLAPADMRFLFAGCSKV